MSHSQGFLPLLLLLKHILNHSPIPRAAFTLWEFATVYELALRSADLRTYLSDRLHHGFRQGPAVADAGHAAIAHHVKPRHQSAGNVHSVGLSAGKLLEATRHKGMMVEGV